MTSSDIKVYGQPAAGAEIKPESTGDANSTNSVSNAEGGSAKGLIPPSWYKPLGQICELLSVLFVVALIGLFWLDYQPKSKVWIAVIVMMVAAALFLAAVLFLSWAMKKSEDDATESERISNITTHVISDQRLLVLIEEKVPRDAFEALRRLINSSLPFDRDESRSPLLDMAPGNPSTEITLSAAELITKLQGSLGKARTEEVKDAILKYTVKDEDSPQKSVSDPSIASSPATATQ
jgi:preprotein translocase subunit SecG